MAQEKIKLLIECIKENKGNPFSKKDLERLAEIYEATLEFKDDIVSEEYAKVTPKYYLNSFYFIKKDGLFYIEK